MADVNRFDSIDRLIRSGEGAEARRQVETWAEKPARRELGPLTQLAWRTDQPLLGVKLLHRPVRGERADASPAERAEYAMCLAKIGASEEALDILQRIDGKSAGTDRRVPLYRAFTFIHRWDYEQAIPLLTDYLRSRPSRYDSVIAKVNLASALVYERRLPHAEALLTELLHVCSLARYRLALGVVLELTASHLILSGRYQEAEGFLARSQASLKGAHGTFEFLVRKWTAIGELRQNRGNPQSRAALQAIRVEAAQRGHWETLRDCDRHEAVTLGRRELALRVLFGTPYESFRRRVAAELPSPLEVPDVYDWDVIPGDGPEIDPYAGTGGSGPEGESRLKPGQRLARALAALCSDFYRPLRVGVLHHLIYPGEYFNPTSSPHRVHEAFHQLRQWMTAAQLPLRIDEQAGTYRLSAVTPCRLRVYRQGEAPSARAPKLEQLRAAWGDRPFSVTEAAEALAVSPRSALRVLGEAIESGTLTKEGRAKSTRYRFTG